MRTIILMVLLHHVADYTLQGWLANAKQIKWWEANAPYDMYRNDWIAALSCHSLYWSVLTFLPIIESPFWPAAVLLNAGLHFWVDHLKCNRLSINLVQDQLFHLAQIVVTYFAIGA